MSVYLLIAVATWIFVIWVIYAAFRGLFGGRGKVDTNGPQICPHCGTRGTPAKLTRGSTLIELIAWLMFIIPGLIYSFWRLSTRADVCPACKQPGMIAVASPRGSQLVRQYAPAER